MPKLSENLSTSCINTTNFVTMDIETIVQNNKLIPYLICAYNGTNYIESFGLNQQELFSNFINSLCKFFKDKNKTLTVFAHNFSNFDGIFLLEQLIPFGTVEPLLFNGGLITIKLKLKIDGYYGKTIIFKDSMLLLPVSLRKWALIFNTTKVKGVFPYKLYDIFYNGVFPRFEFFTDISIGNYLALSQEFNNKIWNFKEQAIKYCKLDCLILFEILTQFNELIFNEFKVNIDKALTLPALAMRIFKSLFIIINSIYQLHGKVQANIRQSYSGGAVDVYIPHNRLTPWISAINEYDTLYCYDVNSLYPFIMANKAMPLGKPTAFTGNINKLESNIYGFFYCKITSPAFLDHPILQRRIKISGGIRTIAGLGTWYDWIYSEEMYNAMKFGYTFEILKGYTFEKGDLFKSFIEKLYNLRLQYPKGHPMNQIAKLLMNSLYGKFGMRDEVTKMEIYNSLTHEDKVLLDSVLDLYDSTITDILQLENHTLLVRKSLSDLNYNEKDDFYHGSEVNVAIASAVTAEARIHMSQFKNNPNLNLYYSDTDSVVFDSPLPESMVGSALGQLKLEYTAEKAVFLAPKVYALILDDGTEVIKVKGLKHNVISNLHFSDLEALLIQDSTREFNQEKWFKSIIKGQISVSDIAYTLKATSNKRQAVYIDGIYEDTIPYFYDTLRDK